MPGKILIKSLRKESNLNNPFIIQKKFFIPLFFSLRESFPLLGNFIFPSGDFDYDLTLQLILKKDTRKR